MLYQVISLAGAILVLAAYVAHQLRRMHVHSIRYQLLNLIGGALLLTTAIVERQYGFILMEGAWTALSTWGFWRAIRAAGEA